MSRDEPIRRRRIARSLLGFASVAALGIALVAATAALPSGTQTSSLVARAAVGLAIGGVLIFVVRRALGALAAPPPAPPTAVRVRESDISYECTVCGTRVRLEIAATAKPPKHCGEEMEARISS